MFAGKNAPVACTAQPFPFQVHEPMGVTLGTTRTFDHTGPTWRRPVTGNSLPNILMKFLIIILFIVIKTQRSTLQQSVTQDSDHIKISNAYTATQDSTNQVWHGGIGCSSKQTAPSVANSPIRFGLNLAITHQMAPSSTRRIMVTNVLVVLPSQSLNVQ